MEQRAGGLAVKRAAPSGSAPEAITAGMPAAVAISAATTFDRMPPEPSGEAEKPMSAPRAGSKPVTSAISSAEGSREGSAV